MKRISILTVHNITRGLSSWKVIFWPSSLTRCQGSIPGPEVWYCKSKFGMRVSLHTLPMTYNLMRFRKRPRWVNLTLILCGLFDENWETRAKKYLLGTSISKSCLWAWTLNLVLKYLCSRWQEFRFWLCIAACIQKHLQKVRLWSVFENGYFCRFFKHEKKCIPRLIGFSFWCKILLWMKIENHAKKLVRINFCFEACSWFETHWI